MNPVESGTLNEVSIVPSVCNLFIPPSKLPTTIILLSFCIATSLTSEKVVNPGFESPVSIVPLVFSLATPVLELPPTELKLPTIIILLSDWVTRVFIYCDVALILPPIFVAVNEVSIEPFEFNLAISLVVCPSTLSNLPATNTFPSFNSNVL